MTDPKPTRMTVFARLKQARELDRSLHSETVGGLLLLAGAVVALVWANTPAGDSYLALMDFHFGPGSIGLNLSMTHWASDGLLAIFFFVAGLELKRELLIGDLRDPRHAMLPVIAAACGVAVPAGAYLAFTAGDSEAMGGWAIPAATDIAFALAVLAVIGSHLPRAIRAFLLTLAVVDDLIAIAIIAVFYTSTIHASFLLLTIVPIILFAVVVRVNRLPIALKVVLAIALALLAWYFMFSSGVHATIAGVLLAFTVRVKAKKTDDAGTDEHVPSPADKCLEYIEPLSAGVVVPIFAFCSAGVALVGGGLAGGLGDRVFYAVVVGLVVGKLVGIFGGTWLTVKFTHAKLDPSVAWIDLLGVALLGGIGFTVSLLVGDLSFGTGPRAGHVKFGVLTASLLSAILGACVLVRRNRFYRDDRER